MLAWLATVGFGVTGLYTAIFASRAKHDRQRAPLLILELLVLGVALVSWFFLIWFLAKILIALGLGAAVALGASIAIGIVLLVPTCAAVWLIVLRSYAALGRSAQFDSDVRNSLWLSRSSTWRPNDF